MPVSMELTKEQKKLQKEAVLYIRANKNRLIKEFVLDKKPLRINFMTIFMAGSPGSGKTEFSKSYLPFLFKQIVDKKLLKEVELLGLEKNAFTELFVRLDVDEIREFLPQYRKSDSRTKQKGNAEVVQKAAGEGLEILREYCFDNNIPFLNDGTFANYDTMLKVVKKSIEEGRSVIIFYLYMDPLAAWNFTKAREHLEGRNIVKEKFIDQYFQSRTNIIRIKDKFKDKVTIHCVLKSIENTVIQQEFSVEDVNDFFNSYVDRGLIKEYTKQDLLQIL